MPKLTQSWYVTVIKCTVTQRTEFEVMTSQKTNDFAKIMGLSQLFAKKPFTCQKMWFCILNKTTEIWTFEVHRHDPVARNQC